MSNVAETIYRLAEFIQMTIKIRSGVDSFNIYQSTVELGPYAFLQNVLNLEPKERKWKGRTVFDFNPSLLSWDNSLINYIKIAPVTNNIEGPLEGPVKIFPLHYDPSQVTNAKTALFVYDETDGRWIPANTGMSAFQ